MLGLTLLLCSASHAHMHGDGDHVEEHVTEEVKDKVHEHMKETKGKTHDEMGSHVEDHVEEHMSNMMHAKDIMEEKGAAMILHKLMEEFMGGTKDQQHEMALKMMKGELTSTMMERIKYTIEVLEESPHGKPVKEMMMGMSANAKQEFMMAVMDQMHDNVNDVMKKQMRQH